MKLIIKSQLLENLKLLRTLYFFLNHNFSVPSDYKPFDQRCKALSLKMDGGSAFLFMESYLVPKQENHLVQSQVPQPLSLIPEIAEMDKISDKAIKEKSSVPVSGYLITKATEKAILRPIKTTPFKPMAFNSPMIPLKNSLAGNMPQSESTEFKMMKVEVIQKLESKWDVINNVAETQKADDKILRALEEIEVFL